MLSDEDKMAIDEIKSLTNEMQIQIKEFSDEEVYASCFDIGEVDNSFSLIEELAKKLRNRIDVFQECNND